MRQNFGRPAAAAVAAAGAAAAASSPVEVYANGELSKDWKDYSYNGHTQLRSIDSPYNGDSFSAFGSYTNFGAMSFFSGHGLEVAAQNSTLQLSFAIRVTNTSRDEVQVSLYGSEDEKNPFSAQFVSHFTKACSLPVDAWQEVQVPIAQLLPPPDPGGGGGGGGNCSDTAPPPGQYTCAQQKGWGKCDTSFMKGYCCKTCFECQSGCGKTAATTTAITLPSEQQQRIKVVRMEFKANYQTGVGAFSLDQLQIIGGSVTPPSPPSPPPPPPSPSPSACPGGNLTACMGLCPASPPIAYKDCIDTCVKKCKRPLMKADDAAAAAAAEAPLIMFNISTLHRTRERIAAGDDALAFATQQLKADAEAAMLAEFWTEGAGPWSVMNKSMAFVASSGDKHDYFSTAKYCWPCNYPCNSTVVKATGNDCTAWTKGGDYHPQKCDNATGLPWLCHDGYANPINDHLDRGLWDSLYYTVPPLALSAFLTGNATQAQRASLLVRTWFLDSASRMNPNLNHAQAIPGSNNGTAGGIIDISDHHKLIDVLDSMTMLRASPDPAVSSTWSSADAAGLMAWVATFKQWIEGDNNSKREARASNNHGTWHDLLSIGLSIFTADSSSVSDVCNKYLSTRIAEQVQPAGAKSKDGGPGPGALPQEDGRTNSQSYHSMDADGKPFHFKQNLSHSRLL